MRIGIFGGTFDPIHLGHLRAAEEVAERLNLDRVWFIPAGRPPHRQIPKASARDRLAMVRLAIASNPRFHALDLEIKRPGKSYTIDTLAVLARRYPRASRFLIIGADQSLTLHCWQGAERLADYSRLVVMTRPGIQLLNWKNQSRLHSNWQSLGQVKFLPINALDISSTAIRGQLQKKRSIQYLVPLAVDRYILRHHLYQTH